GGTPGRYHVQADAAQRHAAARRPRHDESTAASEADSRWTASAGWFSASSASSSPPWRMPWPGSSVGGWFPRRWRPRYAAKPPRGCGHWPEISFWHPTNTSLPSVWTTTTTWAP